MVGHNGNWTVGRDVTRDIRQRWRKCYFGGQEPLEEEMKSDEAIAEGWALANGQWRFLRDEVDCGGQISIG